jgi:aldehyde:ferredoxin oxidoreductase
MRDLLRVDLTTGESRFTPVADVRRDPGFGLLGVRLLLDETPAGLPVYDPGQPIVLGAGPAAGRRALALTRFSVVAKSPLSGGVAEARVEGPFGPALGDGGYEAVVLTGQAARPCYVLIEDRQPRVVDASDLWGLDTYEVTDRLVARHGQGAHVAAIGPAGENLVRFASLVTDRGYAAARMGAVFGAKRCKAVVLVGGAQPDVADPVSLARVTADYTARIDANPLTHSQHAPPGFGAWVAEGLEGYLGARNYSTTKAHIPFGPPDYAALLTQASGGCPGCPQDCMKSFNGNPLHQQAVAAFAANVGIEDLSVVLELNAQCLRWGVDPVSLAGVLAFRCELPGGPEFGDAEALTSLAEEVVWRSGEGAALSDGVARAAAASGPESARYAMHCKGIEMCVFDPRGSHGLALSYAVHPLGPRYDGVEHDIDFDPVDGQPLFIANAARQGCPPDGLPMATLSESKVDLVASLMELWSGYDAIGVCLFAAPPTRNLSENDAAELVSAVTGWDVTTAEIRAWGRRRLLLMRRYNEREGLTSADDVLPERFFTLPVDGGRLAGAVLDKPAFEAATQRLRTLLGWPDHSP